MIKSIRDQYNKAFTEADYQKFVHACQDKYDKTIEFKVCETPIFIPSDFKTKVLAAGEEIIDLICNPAFKQTSKKAIPENCFVPGEEGNPAFIALDFGICIDGSGELIPQLIEMQGFASLYAWQHELGKQYKAHFPIPDTVDHLFNGLDESSYIQLLKKIIIGNHQAENVIILEIEPDKQKTWIDFYLTRSMLNIEPVCISKIIKEGKDLFYLKNGVKTKIHRIYDRLIFDELQARKDLLLQWNLTDEVNVEWVCHPNWFFRISKYTLPFIKSKYVPETIFLNELKSIPDDLENWVLKPLYSFAGHGVKFNVTKQDIEEVMPHGDVFILQKKVTYKPVVATLDEPAKAELRLMYLWDEGESRPQLVINLARLSKGVMIGVDYNKNKTWVGGTVGYYEK